MEANGTTSLAEVKEFVNQHRTDGRAPFLFVDNAGGRTFGSGHLGQLLADLGLHGRCSLTLRTSLPAATGDRAACACCCKDVVSSGSLPAGGPQDIFQYLKVLSIFQSVKRFFGHLFAKLRTRSKLLAGWGQASSAGQPQGPQTGGEAVPSSSAWRRRQNRASDGIAYDNGNGAVFESKGDH